MGTVRPDAVYQLNILYENRTSLVNKLKTEVVKEKDEKSRGSPPRQIHDLKNKNNCDLVVANDLENIRKGNHKAFIIKNSNDYIIASGKEDIAEKIIDNFFD